MLDNLRYKRKRDSIMLTYNNEYLGLNSELSKQIRWVVEISMDTTDTDQVFFTSHADVDTTPLVGEIFESSLVSSPSLASQRLDIFTNKFSIGAIKVNIQDFNAAVSEFFAARLNLNQGLRGKRVRLHRGFAGLDFADYVIPAGGTQVITGDLTYLSNGSYIINAKDVQVDLLKVLFVPFQTSLLSTYTTGDAIINANNTANFEMVAHNASYDADPGVTIGYIQLGDDSNRNIISYTGTTPTSFTGCIGGRFGTTDFNEIVAGGTPVLDRPQIVEHIYLNLPSALIVETILSNTLDAVIPAHWKTDLSSTDVLVSDFTSIGTDIYDPADLSVGFRLTLNTSEPITAKKFIETQVNLPTGTFMPVRADGRLGYLRIGDILAEASEVATLTSADIISPPNIVNDLDDVVNTFIIRWSNSVRLGRTTRVSAFVDSTSVAKHQIANTRDVTFNLLSSGNFGEGLIHSTFNALRSFLSGPPKKITVQTFQVNSALEIGDIVRLRLPIRDVNTGGDLDSSFMLAGIKDNKNVISMDFIGSSQDPGDLGLSQTPTVLDPIFYQEFSPGVPLVPALNLSVATVSNIVGSTLFITGDSTLTGIVIDGCTNINSAYWFDGDVIVGAGVTISTTNNISIRARTLDVLGTLGQAGGGHPGGPAGDLNAGVSGQLGNTVSHGGAEVSGDLAVPSTSFAESRQGRTTQGIWAGGVPPLFLTTDTFVIAGIPPDLMGTSGSSGGSISNILAGIDGGQGGAGGAGIAIITELVTTSGNGIIDVSGANGTQGILGGALGGARFWGGSGAGGAPGGVVFVMNGVGGATATVRAVNGAIPRIGFRLPQGLAGGFSSGTYRSFWEGSDQVNKPLAHSRIIRLENPD